MSKTSAAPRRSPTTRAWIRSHLLPPPRTWRPGRPWLRCVSSSLRPPFARTGPGARHQRSGLQPLFLVGDDTLSRTWLKERGDELRGLPSRGPGSERGQRSAPDGNPGLGKGLQILPAPADDLVDRLGLRHYPPLITSTAIQQ
ncbi:PFL_4695 family integrating conjugative element protein [Pseudomonas aeruginosa]|nr:integrating conjugative element protein [Pseudomonas aeruginosa]